MAGIYGPEPPGRLLSGPSLTPTGWSGRGRSWSLDLSSGVLTHRLEVDGVDVESRRWALAGHPGCQAYSVVVPPGAETIDERAEPVVLTGVDGTVAVVVAADRWRGRELLRATALATARSVGPALAGATKRAERLLALDPGAHRANQDRIWRQRWERCGITIDGDERDERRTRYALHQLLSLADHGDELAMGARGLTGEGYVGHVFWDADVFVLPSLATVVPTAARAMIEYRLRRIPAARRLARRSGHRGARFPWESAASGDEVTPRWITGSAGERLAVRTGELELHISADVAWALWTYRRWTGDDRILSRGGAELAIEVARYWASRVTVDRAGVGHIREVVGPDEYHEEVDDNAFTNRMAAWSLAEARRLVEEGRCAGVGDPTTRSELDRWASIERCLADGFDPSVGRYAQFAGFDDLDPVLARSIAEPPFAADLLVGRRRLQRSQLIKQADVLMLHHLLPDLAAPAVVAADIDHYLPRTAHGSSLSPAIHAAVLAKAGRPDDAIDWFRVALAMDLDDLSRTGSGGLHYANTGAIWQAAVGGFVGIRPTEAGLEVNPSLPAAWERVELSCCYRGTALRVEATHDRVEVTAGEPVVMVCRGDRPRGPTDRMRLVAGEAGWVRR